MTAEPQRPRPPLPSGFDEVLRRAITDPSLDSDSTEIIPMVHEEMPVRVGDVIGERYRVEQIIAKGGVGVVVRARDPKIDRDVAVKLLLPQFAKDAKVRARFQLEARIAGKIASEHVPRVLDVGETRSGAQYLVMEYLTGEDLTSVLARKKKLPVAEAVEMVLQACEAVAQAHAAGIVHRDLKPANLFVSRRPNGEKCVKVIDFGLAKQSALGGSRERAEPSITKSLIIGTPRYMAPEQAASSRAADARADIWALGVILFELCAGKTPFEGPTIPIILTKILHEPAPALDSLRKDVPPELAAIVSRCLHKAPAERYATASELAEALAPFATSRGLRERRGRADRRSAARNRMAAWGFASAAVGAAAVAAASLFWPARGQPLAIGAPCKSDAECAPLQCADGLCSKPCAGPADCAPPSRCGANRMCLVPLRVGFVYVGVPEDEGWTAAHDRARREAAAKLPYLETDFVSQAYRPEVAERAVDDFMARGFDVVVANSSSLREPIAKKARQYPKARFLVYSHSPSPEVGAFGGTLEQAWYVAGYSAAYRSRSDRLGFVGSLATPEIVRYINAFTRGARRHNPAADVEVRWLGFWFDTNQPDAEGRHKEERLTRELLATGCGVIAHNADNGRVVEAVEAHGQEALSIGNNHPNACSRGPATCLGTVAWRWAPLYISIFEDLHRGAWTPQTRYQATIRANPEQSVVSFLLNAPVAGPKLPLETATVLADLANDPTGKRVFEGPYCSSGQRELCLGKGETLSEEETRTMCWFVAGVVEKADPADPRSPDRPAVVPPACAENR